MASDGSEYIADEEVLFRRIPISKGWFQNGDISPEAFDPRSDETTGISVYRQKYKSVDEVAQGKSKHGYYVASCLAGDLLRAGIHVVAKPIPPDDPGHSEIPDLTCHNRESTQGEEIKIKLASIFGNVKGPFLPTPPPT